MDGFTVLASSAAGATTIATPTTSGGKPITYLFIDDLFCSDEVVNCYVSCESLIPPAGNVGSLSMCWNFVAFACEPCTDWSVLDATCNLRVPECGGARFANYPLRCGVRT